MSRLDLNSNRASIRTTEIRIKFQSASIRTTEIRIKFQSG